MDDFDFRWHGNFLDRPPRGDKSPNGPSAIFLVLFLVILAALSLAGCEGKEPTPVEPKKPGKSDFISLTEPLPEPGKYSVHLKWTGYETDGLWLISRKEAGEGLKGLEALSRHKDEYEDATVEAGKTYTYYLSTIHPGANSVLATLEVKIPTDLRFSGTVYRNGQVTAARVFFERGARLVTQGQDLTLVADQIFSDDGVIETFPEGQETAPGAPGRAGGQITVRARRGSGTLRINGRGENGGAGAPGQPGLAGSPGARGRDGYGTHEKVDVVCNCGDVSKRLRKQMEGNFHEALLGRMQFMMLHQQHRCIQETGNGAPGGQGQLGGNGAPGARGGASARIEVQLEDPASLQVKAEALPGKGGRGGVGGVGGPGGRGGAPGDRVLDFFFNCREAAKGPDGSQGPAGANGAGGADGARLPMCLKLGSAKFGDC